MTRIQFLLSATLFAVTLVPALATEQFECPSPFKPNTPAKLEEIKGSLPDVDAMGNIGRVTATIDTLRREGMSTSLSIDQRIGVLSAYLGHISPADTYWYLSASPELMQLAAQRLHAHFGHTR